MSATVQHPRDQEMERWHIVPVNDWREHEPSCVCWCHPQPDEIDERVMLHNAMDQRDKLVRGELWPQ